jgi:hypothetical protein
MYIVQVLYRADFIWVWKTMRRGTTLRKSAKPIICDHHSSNQNARTQHPHSQGMASLPVLYVFHSHAKSTLCTCICILDRYIHVYTGLLIQCGKKWQIMRHFHSKLCSNKDELCGKLCDFFLIYFNDNLMSSRSENHLYAFQKTKGPYQIKLKHQIHYCIV